MSKIKKKIKGAFNSIVLPDFDMKTLEKRKGMVLVKEESKKSKKGLWIGLSTAVVAVCVCLFIGLGYFNNNMRVASTIGIDVNPSITVTVNKKEKVLDVTANNDDARIILEGMDLAGSDINVAINALIGSMVKNGYIDDLANSILISVDNPNSAESEALRQKIVDELNAFINNGNNISVVSQSITSSSDKEALANSYGISVGKLELIEKLIAKNNLYTYEELKNLSINELNLLLGSTTENVTTSGTASDKSYIGKDKALEIALSDAGVSSVTWSEVEMDYDDGLMTYEVEFYYNNNEYEYEIDAVNGAIIKSEKDYDDDYVNNNTNNSSNNTSNNNQSSGSSNNSTSSGSTTTVNTSGITSTLSDYTKEAESIENSINNLIVPSNRSEVISLYWEWKEKLETLENKIDRYEDELERMYRNNQLSYSDFRNFDRELESIENILDRAEDILEYRTNYDD